MDRTERTREGWREQKPRARKRGNVPDPKQKAQNFRTVYSGVLCCVAMVMVEVFTEQKHIA